MIVQRDSIRKYAMQHPYQKIVAICGCFDILHYGHLEYITGAKALGDVLFAGVNADISVYENKKGLPVFSQTQRLKMLDSCKFIDYSFLFYEKTFDKSLEILNPDIFARGIDASMKDFPEQNTASELCIDVCYIGEKKISSSSALRRYFKNS